MTRGAIVRALLGSAISIIAIVVILQAVDLDRVLEVLGRAQLWLVAVVVGLVALDLLTRALRWQRILAPIGRVGYRRTLEYLLIGYLANNVIPIRLGELVRSHFLGDREGISRATALGTIVVERVIDTLVATVIAAVAIAILGVHGTVVRAVGFGAAVVAILCVGLGVALVAHRLPGADALRRLVDRWERIGSLVRLVRDGLAVAGRPSTVAQALALTLLAWWFSLLAFTAVGAAVGVPLDLPRAALLSSGIALAAAIPAGPASLGTYEVAGVALGRAIGIGAEEAFAIALIAHASVLAVTSIGGLVALARVGRGFTVASAMAVEAEADATPRG